MAFGSATAARARSAGHRAGGGAVVIVRSATSDRSNFTSGTAETPPLP